MSLPPLPTHDGYVKRVLIDDECNNRGYDSVRVWAEEKMLAYGRACRDAALEEAASIFHPTSIEAAAIRSLKDQEQPSDDTAP